MRHVVRTVFAATAMVVGLSVTAERAEAQLQPVIYGVTEWDTEGFQLYLLGATIQPNTLGWHWTAGVQAMQVSLPERVTAPNPETTFTGVMPHAGIRHAWPTAAVAWNLGWMWSADDEVTVVGVPFGGEPGIVNMVQWDYWGTGNTNVHVGVSHNFAASYMGARLHATQRIAGPLHVGGEVVGQGGQGYTALQAGPRVGFDLMPNLRIGGAAGMKWDTVADGDPANYPYFKVDFTFAP
jgi:hypothetical protein